MSMITATAWVPRGFAAPFPVKQEFDEAEFDRIAKLAKLQLEDAQQDLDDATNLHSDRSREDGSTPEKPRRGLPQSKADIDDDLKEYDLEHYDDDGPETEDSMQMNIMGNIRSMAFYESNADDPYITLPEGEEEDEEREDLQILATDNLLLAAKVEDEISHLEIYVYEDDADNLYVHHDIMLPAIPLAVEWLDLPVGKSGADPKTSANFVAIATFDPDIEIWDLDVVDCMYPNAILGKGAQAEIGDVENGKKKKAPKKKRKAKTANDNYHVDAVLSLAANRHHRNLLASSSADMTVKLWDLNTTKCAKSYSHHSDKICTLAWHPKDSTVLLSGSYDRTVVAADMRAPDGKMPRWRVESDVENVKWDPHDPNYFYISTENGVIHFHDARLAPPKSELSKAVWTLQAHDESVSAFDVNPIIPGYLVTGSSDKTVKLWNIKPEGPSMIVSRDVGVGKVFSSNFAPDNQVGFRLAVAGSKGFLQVWDTSTNAAVRRAFAERVALGSAETEERLIGLREESSDSDDDEEGEDGDVETAEMELDSAD